MTDREIKIGDYIKTKHGPAKVELGDDCYIAVSETHVVAATYFKDRIEPITRKEAFLSRLGALLKEFDADIIASQSDLGEVSLYFNIDGDDTVGYCDEDSYFILTADNIMDFEKE